MVSATAVVLVIAVAFGTCVGGLARSIKAPADAANAFARDVIAGDLDSAFERSCPTVKEELGYEKFAASIGSLGVTSVDLTSTNVTRGTDRIGRAVAEGTMTADGVTRPLRVELVEVGGEWQVCGFYRTDGPFPSEDAET